MRRLTLWPCNHDEDEGERSAALSSETSGYVSLADQTPSAASSRRQLPLLLHETSEATDGVHLAPLSARSRRCLHRLQDVLLCMMVALSLVVICWAWTQLYRGRLCAPSGCSLDTSFASRGAPDFILDGDLFEGGWSLPYSLVHVLVPAVLVLSVIALRLQFASVHDARAWIGFASVELAIVLVDSLTLRWWKSTTCSHLHEALLNSRPMPLSSSLARCVATSYEALVAVEALLVVLLAALVLLEPVLLRLWCPPSRENDDDDEKASETPVQLVSEDEPTPLAQYRRL